MGNLIRKMKLIRNTSKIVLLLLILTSHFIAISNKTVISRRSRRNSARGPDPNQAEIDANINQLSTELKGKTPATTEKLKNFFKFVLGFSVSFFPSTTGGKLNLPMNQGMLTCFKNAGEKFVAVGEVVLVKLGMAEVEAAPPAAEGLTEAQAKVYDDADKANSTTKKTKTFREKIYESYKNLREWIDGMYKFCPYLKTLLANTGYFAKMGFMWAVKKVLPYLTGAKAILYATAAIRIVYLAHELWNFFQEIRHPEKVHPASPVTDYIKVGSHVGRILNFTIRIIDDLFKRRKFRRYFK